MIATRDNLENTISDFCHDIALDKEKRDTLYNDMLEKYGIPSDITSDIVTNRAELGEYTDCVLYCVLSLVAPRRIKKYFSQEEIDKYSKYKYKKTKFKLPVVFEEMIQVQDDQWIGKISARELINMRTARFINYNTNTQRTMHRVNRGHSVYYKISINKKSVKEIRKLYEKGIYIPDEITLNIPDGNNFLYENGDLIFTDVDHLDILDGYHRLMALSQACIANPEFNYVIELRITNFSEDKAEQFIYQKGQKTKMSKIDSDSFNQNNISNIIVKKLNEDSGFELYGNISRNGGLVSTQEISQAIEYFMCKNYNINSKNERMITNKIKEDIKNRLNPLILANPELYNTWDAKTICIVVYTISRYDNPDEIQKEYERVKKAADKKENSFYSKQVRQNTFFQVSRAFSDSRR